MTPAVVIALANLRRRRRWDTAPRTPFADVARARQALAEARIAVDDLTEDDLPGLARLAEAVSDLADRLALGRQPASRSVEVVNGQAAACTATIQAAVHGRTVQSVLRWRDPNPVAALARRVIEELAGADPSRIRQCQRKECDLLFFDTTRSRSQRWHAENPCGWLARQHRRRGRN